MKRLLLILALSTCAFAANGDITAVRILGAAPHNGWAAEIDIAGLSTGGTYSLGAAAGSPSWCSGTKIVFTVTSKGFDTSAGATTITRTVCGTQFVRQAYSGSTASIQEGTLGVNVTADEAVNAGTLTVRVALSDYIYVNTADTAVTVTIASGFYTQGGMPNNAVTNLSVTNNSTVAYPAGDPVRWATVPYQRVTGDFLIEAVGFNRFAKDGKPFAAVAFSCADAHAHTITSTVNSMTVSTQDQPGMPRVLVYAHTVPVASFTAGDVVTCNVKTYPWVGDSTSVTDSSGGTAGGDQLGPLPMWYNATQFAYAYVISTGSDANCNNKVFTTAAAAEASSGFLTWQKAATCITAYNNTNYGFNNPSGSVILMADGNWTLNNVSADQGAQSAWLTIQPASAATRAGVVFNSGNNTAMNVRLLRFYNVTLSNASTGALRGSSATSRLWLDSDSINLTGTGAYYAWIACYATNNSVTALSNGFKFFSTNKSPWALVRGNSASSAGAAITPIYASVYAVLGNRNFRSAFMESNNAPGQSTSDGGIWAFNTTYNVADWPVLEAWFSVSGITTNITKGVAVVQNVIERAVAGSNPLATIGGDTTTSVSTNLINWHNTFVGQRYNRGYNDGNPAPAQCSASWLHQQWSERYSIFANSHVKTDVFSNVSCTPAMDGRRTGNWGFAWCAGCAGSYMHASSGDTTAFKNEYWGIGGFAAGTRGFVTDASSQGGSGAGNGNYHLRFSASARGIVSAGAAVLPFDIEGNPRSNTGGGAIGAYEAAQPHRSRGH